MGNNDLELVRVLYVMGPTRSGSTLLDAVLGQLDGFFSTGELHYLWDRALLEGRLCGCGRPTGSCEVWDSVLRDVFGSDWQHSIRPGDLASLRERVMRVRQMHSLLTSARRARVSSEAVARYVEIFSALYSAIRRVTGARVIVDSSKRPSGAAMLLLMPSVIPAVVHLVRDPRGVAYSWQRSKRELDRGRPADMPRWSSSKAALSWLSVNAASELIRRRYPPERFLTARYEDFIREPGETVQKIIEIVGEGATTISLTGERAVYLRRNHTVSGNPSRFNTGMVTLDADQEWIHGQSRTARLVATLLTLPLLNRYGYPLIPSATGGTLPPTGIG